jgi:hypothetical protein
MVEGSSEGTLMGRITEAEFVIENTAPAHLPVMNRNPNLLYHSEMQR